MNSSTLRSKLHDYIERADEQHLAAIYVLVEGGAQSPYTFDAATLDMLHQRREAHLNGESKSYTVEESMQAIRSVNR